MGDLPPLYIAGFGENEKMEEDIPQGEADVSSEVNIYTNRINGSWSGY